MHKKFFIVTAIVLAVAAGLTASVYAQGPHRGFGHRSGGMLNHMTKELNLTEEQQSQVKSILDGERSRTKPLMEQLRQNEQAQNQQNLKTGGSFDDLQVRAFANNQAQIMRDLIIEKQRTKSQIYSVLTPDQRQKALQLIQQHEQRRQERLQKKSAQ
jgi:Spy/CpxP family protein refolding chaperone